MSLEDPNQPWGDKFIAFNIRMRERITTAYAPIHRLVVNPLYQTGKFLFKCTLWVSCERENGEVKYNDSGLPVFSLKRLLTFSAGAAGAAIGLIMAFYAAYYYATQFEELVYTTGKQEIETGELYQFTGCTSLPCSTEAGNGKFYEIESSVIFPILFYPEEDVYANIPQQDGACYAKGHGIYFRDLRHLHTKFNFYQKVHSVSCRPYTDEERATAIGSGAIPQPKEIMPQ